MLRLSDHAHWLFSPTVHIHRAVDKQIYKRFEESGFLGRGQIYIDINVNDDIRSTLSSFNRPAIRTLFS